jgi:death on curing protein
MKRLELDDFLLLAEAITGIDATALADAPHIVARAESALAAPFVTFDGVDLYEGLAMKAAVLCSRVVRNHPLPDGNKRAAYLSMIELIRRNGREWAPVSSTRERAAMVERLAAREIEEGDFAAWLGRQMVSPGQPDGERALAQPRRVDRVDEQVDLEVGARDV